MLSAILVSLFLEDLELYLQKGIESGLSVKDITLMLFLFADDMCLYGESPHELQNNLNLLHSYCLDWGLQVNVMKTKVIVFR